MNEHLAKTLKELEDAHAESVPTADDIMAAPDDTEWSGQIKDGGDWKLIKHAIDSYTNNTRTYS